MENELKLQKIAEKCDSIIYSIPAPKDEEMIWNLRCSAGIIEDYITKCGCNVLGWSARQAARYIKEYVARCGQDVQNDVHFLLIEELSKTTH